MKLFVIIILSLFLVQGCAAQSKLPAEMPEKISVYLTQSGAMRRSYKQIKIDDGVLEFGELTGNQENPQKWSVNLSRDDLAKLYKVFVENKFDTVKNDERKGIVYDAGSENISISINKTQTFRVTYGKNSPLSGKNLERYQAVRNAIYDLIVQSQNSKTDDSSSKNPATSEAEKYIQGSWRRAGENGGRAWFLEWNFDSGKFKQTGYPPIMQAGKYKVVSVADNQITLELYDQKGTFGEEKKELQIFIDKEAKRLTISGTTDFSRIEVKKID